MKIQLSLKFENGVAPRSLEMCGASLIKGLISLEDEELFDEIFKYGDAHKNKKSKAFTYSFNRGNFKVNYDKMYPEGNIIMKISTYDDELGELLLNALKVKTLYIFKEYRIIVESFSTYKEKVIESERVVFKTLSNIFLKDENSRHVNIGEELENTNRMINHVMNMALFNARGYGLKKELKYTPLEVLEVTSRQEIKHFTNQTGKRFYLMRTYKAKFILEGDVEDLNCIYKIGIGNSRSIGFGNLDIVGEKNEKDRG